MCYNLIRKIIFAFILITFHCNSQNVSNQSTVGASASKKSLPTISYAGFTNKGSLKPGYFPTNLNIDDNGEIISFVISINIRGNIKEWTCIGNKISTEGYQVANWGLNPGSKVFFQNIKYKVKSESIERKYPDIIIIVK